MYTKNKIIKTSLQRNERYEGERIEKKVARITTNKEPITDGAPLIYTDRKDGVLPNYDIRTDRMEIAQEAMDKVSKSHKAKREEKASLGKTDTTDKAAEKQTVDTVAPTKTEGKA